MIQALALLLLVALAGYLVYVAEREFRARHVGLERLRAALELRERLELRLLELERERQEQQLEEVRGRTRNNAPRAVKIPEDLVAVACQWDDEWARDQAITRMLELYQESSDWNLVRLRYGVGQMDGQS